MVLQVCADESYRQYGGNNVVAIAGWLCKPSKLNEFIRQWGKVLKKYGVNYFHFREFADRHHKHYNQTIYDHLNDQKRESFLYELALIACEMGSPVGGCHPMPPAKSKDLEKEKESKRKAYRALFETVRLSQKAQFKPDDTVEFIFDFNDDTNWTIPLLETLTEYVETKGAPFSKVPSFKDDKIFPPLQAADLYVYAVRQNAERFFKNDQQNQAQMLDLILEKNRYDLHNWKYKKKVWKETMQEVIAHSREWKTRHVGEKYYPLKDCPFLYTTP